MSRKQAIIRGTFILTFTGFLTRFIGFFYRVFLSQQFGEEGVGLYQLIFPIYALCYSFSVAGIEIALSRNVAGKISLGKHKEAKQLLKTAIVISVILSCLMTILLQAYAAPIAVHLLGDGRCEPLLIAMSYAFPFAAVHSCICGYYLGLKQTKVQAVSQLIEQSGRVVLVYLFIMIATKKAMNIDISMAVLGLVLGEILSSLYCISSLKKGWRFTPASKSTVTAILVSSRELLPLAVPLTANRVLLNILQSIEAVSIPRFLQVYGNNTSEALSTYGVLMGMALPCILFPSAITNSVSMMMLPTVAEIQAAEDHHEMRRLIRQVSSYCFLLGVFCMIIFLITGNYIGTVLFHSENAGRFIVTLAWICPFLYGNTTLISMMNGLGRANTSFVINSIGLLLRIVGVFFLIPIFGIIGYLWGLLASQLVVTILCFIQLREYLLPVKKS